MLSWWWKVLHNFDRLSISWSASNYCWYLFWQEHGLGAPQCLCRCFMSVVLIRTLPNRISRLIFAMTSARFCLPKSTSWFLLLWSLNWIHSKIISVATFCIIGLTKIPKIEFLLLDWIYRSIRIMTVSHRVWVKGHHYCTLTFAISKTVIFLNFF